MRLLNDKVFKFYPRYFGWKAPNGLLHTGYDIIANEGQAVFSPVDGKIVYSSNYVKGYGTHGKDNLGGCIWIAYNDPDEGSILIQLGHVLTRYPAGFAVTAGDFLGVVDNYICERQSCPHIHIALYRNHRIPDGTWGYVNDLSRWIDAKPFLTSIEAMNRVERG